MTYSEQIDLVINKIKSLGFNVTLFSSELPDDIAGRTFYNKKEVHIGNLPSAEEALFTLVHEAGHVLSYDKYYCKLNEKQPEVEKREIYAYLYGWVIIKQLNLSISKEDWRKFDYDK